MFKNKKTSQKEGKNERPDFLKINDVNELFAIQRRLNREKTDCLNKMHWAEQKNRKEDKNLYYSQSVDLSIQISMLKNRIRDITFKKEEEREKIRLERNSNIKFIQVFYDVSKKELNPLQIQSLERDVKNILGK